MAGVSDIIHLNVGGTRFSTSRQTLTWVADSFFTALLSGRIPSLRDDSGAIFIDRDPKLFSVILNYLRSRDVDLSGVNLECLRHDAEFYGLQPLVRRLVLCEELGVPTCGGVLFHALLSPAAAPQAPASHSVGVAQSASASLTHTPSARGNSSCSAATEPAAAAGSSAHQQLHLGSPGGAAVASCSPHDGGGASVQTARVSDSRSHSRQSSQDLRLLCARAVPGGHSRTSSVDYQQQQRSVNSPSAAGGHSRQSSASGDLYKQLQLLSAGGSGVAGRSAVTAGETSRRHQDQLAVRLIRGHHNWLVAAYQHHVSCYRVKDSTGWRVFYTSPHLPTPVDRVAISAKVPGVAAIGAGAAPALDAGGATTKMLAVACQAVVHLWAISEDGTRSDVGRFDLGVAVEHLFFIGPQLVALSSLGRMGVWHAVSQHWQAQDIGRVASFDRAGTFLLLGGTNGSIYYIDMQKFPLRMKDNDLLVTELYHDVSDDAITAISVYLTPKTSMCGNWIEIAYGTSSGIVRVIVQHPETVGHGPQLFQTFAVHRSPVTKVSLSERYLISACSEYHHVRSWSVTRFRGMISTQPGSQPLASFKIVSLEPPEHAMAGIHAAANAPGPYGDQDDEQVFVQKVVPDSDQLFVRRASDGRRVCKIRSIDGTTVSAFCIHECEGSSRMACRPRRYLITGHAGGSLQMWDMTTALEQQRHLYASSGGAAIASAASAATVAATGGAVGGGFDGGPTPEELVRILEPHQLSLSNTPCPTPLRGGCCTPHLNPPPPSRRYDTDV